MLDDTGQYRLCVPKHADIDDHERFRVILHKTETIEKHSTKAIMYHSRYNSKESRWNVLFKRVSLLWNLELAYII